MLLLAKLLKKLFLTLIAKLSKVNISNNWTVNHNSTHNSNCNIINKNNHNINQNIDHHSNYNIINKSKNNYNYTNTNEISSYLLDILVERVLLPKQF